MNILFFTQLFYPYVFGGGEYIFFLFAREFSRRGHNVHVITQRLKDTVPFEIYEGINIHRVGTEYSYRGTLPPTIRHNLDYLINASKKGRELIKENRKKGEPIDLIHSNTYVPVLAGHLCAKFNRIPHVVTFHDVYQASDKGFWKQWRSKQESNLPFYAPLMAKLVEDLILKLDVSKFHTVSEMTKDDLTSYGVNTSKIVVIPNGIEKPPHVVSGNQHYPRERTAVFVGRLVHYKNVDTVIRAFRGVVKSVPDVKLVIIGDGPYRNTLVQEAKSLEGSVEFKGRVTEEEKIRLIAESSFMVFPSLIEGFGIATIEGFAQKKPVLVSDVRPLSDIVQDNFTGFVIPAKDPVAWEQRIIEAFSDKEKMQKIADNAYNEFTMKYEISRVIDRLNDLYDSVMLTQKQARGKSARSTSSVQVAE